jgi:3'-5' exoribonuclease
MKQKYVAQLKVEDKITDFYMVKATGVKQDTNGRSYLDIMLMDNSGEITAKKWDLPDEEAASLSELKEGDLVKVKGQITDWKNQKQIRIEKIRKAAESDGLEISDFVKSAPEDPQEMYDFIHKTVEGFEDAHLRTLALRFLDSEKERLLYYPAASKNHHAEMGGLLYHIKRMLMAGMRACEVYTCLNRDLLLCGVVVHDMEKLNEIESDKNGVSPGYSFEGQLLGHIVQGVREIERMTKEIEGFPREKAIMVEHMILSHHYEPEYGSPKKPLFPEAEMLHYLDIVDARMFDFEEALSKTEPGDFSDRVFTLDNRRIYKHSEDF